MSADGILTRSLSLTGFLYKEVIRRRANRRYLESACEALTIGYKQLGKTGYRHRSDLPGARVHPDNVAGMVAVLQGLVARAERLKRLDTADDLKIDSTDSILTVGGPVWDRVTRSIFGYEQHVDPDQRGYPRYFAAGLALALPFRFNLDADAIKGRALRNAEKDGAIVPEEGPNWGIISTKGERRYPLLGGDNFLKTDYLVLTKLPNLLCDPTMGSERSFVNFAGTHGVGQRGVDLLMRDQGLIKRVVHDLKIDVDRAQTWPEAYQVVFRVGDIEHHPQRSSRPRSLILDVAQRIDESDDWWDDWRVKAQHEWQQLQSTTPPD